MKISNSQNAYAAQNASKLGFGVSIPEITKTLAQREKQLAHQSGILINTNRAKIKLVPIDPRVKSALYLKKLMRVTADNVNLQKIVDANMPQGKNAKDKLQARILGNIPQLESAARGFAFYATLCLK